MVHLEEFSIWRKYSERTYTLQKLEHDLQGVVTALSRAFPSLRSVLFQPETRWRNDRDAGWVEVTGALPLKYTYSKFKYEDM